MASRRFVALALLVALPGVGCGRPGEVSGAEAAGIPGGSVVPGGAAATSPDLAFEGDPTPHQALPPARLLEIAMRHYAEGNLDSAAAHLDLALAQDGEDPLLWDARATVRSALGDWDGALADAEAAVALAPSDPALLSNRSQVYLRFGRRDAALADLDAALAARPEYVPALFNRGTLLLQLGREEDALRDLDEAIRLQPELTGPWFNRAMVRRSLGDAEGAVADLEAFLEREDDADRRAVAESVLTEWRGGGGATATGGEAPEAAVGRAHAQPR